MNRGLFAAIVAFVIVAIGLWSSAFTVAQSENALVLRLGNPKREVTEPGLYFRWPMVENVVKVDKRVRNFDTPAKERLTRDQKRVMISAYVRYKITQPLRFYQVGKSTLNAEGQLRSVLESTLRSVIGNTPMTDILTPQRAVLMAKITKDLTTQATPYGIEIIDVRFKRVDLPPENSEAVYNQMRTQRAQEAAGIRAEGANKSLQLKAQADKDRVVTLAEAQRQASILRGEGEAEATGIYNEAFGQDPEFFDFYRSMQAMQEGLGGNNTTYVGPPTGDFFRYFGNQPGTAPAAQ
jgi:membrane protease subunit HflC